MTDIRCTVKHCVHNESSKEMCELKSITVVVPDHRRGTDDSSCGDFEPEEGSLKS